MTIDELIEICERESKRLEKTPKKRSEFDYGYTVAYEQCLRLAREVKLSMLQSSAEGVII